MLANGMVSDWKNKLFEAIKADGRKDRAIGIAAKLGPNFVGQMRGTDKTAPKEPSFENVVRLCVELGIEPASLFATGAEGSKPKTAPQKDLEREALKAKLGEQFAKLLQADPTHQRIAIQAIEPFVQSIPAKSRNTKTKAKSSSI